MNFKIKTLLTLSVLTFGFVFLNVSHATMTQIDPPDLIDDCVECKDSDVDFDVCGDELLLNGGFEAADDREGLVHGNPLEDLGSTADSWDVYDTLPDETNGAGTSWFTVDDTSGIEIQYDGTVTTAHSGVHYAEMDSHDNATNGGDTNSSMSQMVNTGAGDFLLEFYFQPRTESSDDNIIEVLFDGLKIGEVDGTNPEGGWVLVSLPILGVAAGDHEVTFRARGAENTLGGFLDDVSLKASCDNDPGDDDDDDDDDDVPESTPEGSGQDTGGDQAGQDADDTGAGNQLELEGSGTLGGCSLELGAVATPQGLFLGWMILLSIPAIRKVRK